MTKTAVVGIVEYEGKVLIGKKVHKAEILSDAWHVPGGKILSGESEKEALEREIKEEAGIRIIIKSFIDEKYIPEKDIIVKWYACKSESDNVIPGSDLADVRFVEKSRVKELCDPVAVSLWPPKVRAYFGLEFR